MERRALGRTLTLLLGLAGPAFAVGPWPEDLADPHNLIKGVLEPSGKYASLQVFPEKLVFDVDWGLIDVGQATLEAPRLVDFGGIPAYEIISQANSNPFCSTFYKVRDVNKSWIDARGLYSLGYMKKLREGHFYRDEWVLFDPVSKVYRARTIARDGAFSVRTGTIPVRVQDVLSSLYFVRFGDLTPGKEIILDVNTKENWPLVIKVIKRETIRVKAGKFKTILVEPMLRKEGIFIQKGKRLQVWLTDDERKMVVQMKVEVFFGHITAKLESYEPR